MVLEPLSVCCVMVSLGWHFMSVLLCFDKDVETIKRPESPPRLIVHHRDDITLCGFKKWRRLVIGNSTLIDIRQTH